MTFKRVQPSIYVTDPAAVLMGINVPENILLGQTVTLLMKYTVLCIIFFIYTVHLIPILGV